MRIAIYTPEPRVCGPTACAFHLRHGFRTLGHACDVVTFTRSGRTRKYWGPGNMRSGTQWWGEMPDRTWYSQVGNEVLDTYDAVILDDVRTVVHDRAALHGSEPSANHRSEVPGEPTYLTVLSRTGTPFTTALHGNYYPPEEVPFADRLVGLPNFTGTAVTYAPYAPVASKSVWPHVAWLESPLPYRMHSDPDSDAVPTPPEGDTAGILGRYTGVKGHHVLAVTAALGLIPAVAQTTVWGAASVAPGASPTLATFESLVDTMGLPGQREGEPRGGHPAYLGGNVTHPHPWRVDGPTGPIRYAGGYEDGCEAAKSLTVHVDLTTATFSHGMEFSQFEAIDAGCLQVSVESMWHPGFRGTPLPSVPRWPYVLRTQRRRPVLAAIGEAVGDELAKDTARRAQDAQANRRLLSTRHDPAAVARVFLEALG